MTFNQFVLSLFDTPIGIDFNTDFKQKIKTVSDRDVSQFWDSLLTFLKARPNMAPTTLLQEDFGEDSFFDYIQTKSDNDPLIDSLSGYWNESIQAMVDYYNQYFNNNLEEITNNTLNGTTITNGRIPLTNDNSFSTRDIKNADAAQAFGLVNETVFTELVRPWYNVDWDSYYKVRYKLDNKAITQSDNLTFTREQQAEEFDNNLNRFIRLIMPNNSRRVSVEDLNRNFWVISSVIQAISADLFGAAAPIPYLLKNALNEIAQLWDNVMYLWSAFGIISQKEASDMRVIILPLPKSEYTAYQKYDNSTISFPLNLADQREYVLKRTKFLIQKYSHSNLCIIPYTKQNNYYLNYYASQTFRGVVFYNRKTNKTTYVPFRATVDGEGNKSLYFNPQNFDKYLYAIRETDTYYKWSFPIKNIHNVLDSNDFHSKRFYAAIRIIPQIDFKVNADGELELSNLVLTGIDAAAQSLFENNAEILRYSSTEPITESSEYGEFLGEYLVDEPALGNLDIYDGVVKQAYYLGEIPSCSNLSASQPVFIYDDGREIIGEGKLIKIGNYLPKNFTSYYTNTAYYDQQKVPSGARPTDYLLNLTITGSSHKSTVKAIYGGSLGSGNVVDDAQCYYFSPVINSKNSYSLTHNSETPDMLNANDYKQRGFDVISDYIAKDTTPDTITYFIAGVGIKPWHNTEANSLFQGYWTTTVLTHMYRYIPADLENYIDPSELINAHIVYKDGIKIGDLQCLGAVNKREQAFSTDGGVATDTFVQSGGTTWRLPQLNPQKEIASYLIYTEQLSQTTYFIDATDAHFAPIYSNGGAAAITNELNTNYADYMSGGQYESELMTADNIRLQLHNPSGNWCIFDGNSNANHSSNVDKYRKQTDRREVAYTGFNFVNNELQFTTPHKGRKISQSNFVNLNPSDNLLPDGFNNMVFSW